MLLLLITGASGPLWFIPWIGKGRLALMHISRWNIYGSFTPACVSRRPFFFSAISLILASLIQPCCRSYLTFTLYFNVFLSLALRLACNEARFFPFLFYSSMAFFLRWRFFSQIPPNPGEWTPSVRERISVCWREILWSGFSFIAPQFPFGFSILDLNVITRQSNLHFTIYAAF